MLEKCKEACAVMGAVLEVNVKNGKIVAVLNALALGGYTLPWGIKEDIKHNVLEPCTDYPINVKIKGSFDPDDYYKP